jgi:Reverse transcriptase (RNA-dependent DNA polymerase).
MEKFTDITTRSELANFLGIPKKKLTHVLYIEDVNSKYRSFEIPKKNGGVRHINAPTDDLKNIQRKLADALWKYQESIWHDKGISPNLSHAFEKEKSIITNAKIHRNKRLLLNIDLENFFDSFHFGRVRGFFEKNREFQLPNEVATVIAQLTCYNGCLPQGAPSSPIITNLICQSLDVKLLRIAKKYKLDYTRYADDLTLSTNNHAFLDKQAEFYIELSKEIKSAGFSINNDKTRLQFRDSKQKVTGLIVNKKLNIDRVYYRKTKAMANSLYTKGHFEIEGFEGSIKQLEGRFAFIDQLDKYNNKLSDTKNHNCLKLNGREEQYRKFLFYKYFFSNDKPLIITEGKTDIVYLKAALKNLYAEYPGLITKDSDGKYLFKISFLKRSSRLCYFFKFCTDGADTMQKLYNFFDPKIGDKNNFPDYLSYFNKINPSPPKNPVILVFDNELQNDKKPLSNFVRHIKLLDEKKNVFHDELSIKLIDSSNLFLLTNPLVGVKSECEIEDLFNTETLENTINGKSFSRESKFDINRYYGKEKFSEYIYSNYKNIDFSGFKSMLDNLNQIIESY